MSESFSIKEIRSLLEMLQKHEVTEFKLERGEERIWLKRAGSEQAVAMMPQPSYQQMQMMHQAVNMQQPQTFATHNSSAPSYHSGSEASAATGQVSPAAPSLNGNLKEIVSPMVGTFYRRPAVDAEPYVEVGDVIKKGEVLCIVEAMKLMNEIETEFAGRIVDVCLEDGQMVEYGEVLFRIEPL